MPADLLAHLIQRGLIVLDRVAALHALERIGYYRLLIYMRGLQSPGGKWFNPGTTFDQILEIYEFDRQLRLICFDAVERLEVALRAAINNSVSVVHGPHFYEDRAQFVSAPWFNYTKLLRRIDDAESLGISHYKHEYSTPARPPIWVVLEAVTLGTLSQLFSGLTPANQQLVGNAFSLPPQVLVSWFRSLTSLRNLCAHHSRLWASHLPVDQPKRAHQYAAEFPRTDTPYARLVVASILLADVDKSPSTWRQRVLVLFRDFPNVAAAVLGFPAGWEARAIWR